ncbi:MAG: MFS transporter, partial [Deltaproteobacteria bacterium]|nr:MFS transporter [Deltaproteobacteria bacterium]
VGRLGLDVAQVLGLSFWMYLLFGLTALPWGLVADKWQAKKLLLLFFVGAGVCSLGAGLMLDSPLAFALALAGIGLFSGIYHPVGLGLISKGIERVPMAMGYNGMFGSLGLAMAPLLAGLSNWLAGPRAVFLAVGGLNLAGAGLMAALKLAEPRPPKTAPAAGRQENGLVGPFLILLAIMTLGGLTYRGVTVILPTYLELKGPGLYQVLKSFWPGDLSPNLVATSLASLTYALGILGQYIGGRVGERFDPRWSYLVFHALSLPSVFLLAWATDLPMFVLALVYLFFLLGMQPVENTLVARLTPGRFHHSAYGAKFILAFGVGALAVKLVGAVQALRGVEAVFLVLGLISSLLVATILLLISRTKPLKRGGVQARP